MKIDGYVILSPFQAKPALKLASDTFGITPRDAWSKWLGGHGYDPDRSIKIQRAHDKGYRLRRVTMELLEEDES